MNTNKRIDEVSIGGVTIDFEGVSTKGQQGLLQPAVRQAIPAAS